MVLVGGAMESNGVRHCPLCAGSARELIVRLPLAESDFVPERVLEVASCLTCGMGFSTAAAGQSEVDARYETHSKYAVHIPKPAGSPEPGAFLARPEPEWDLSRLQQTAVMLTEHCDPAAPTLDVGCATGALLAALEAKGFTALYGLDPSPHAVRTAAATTRATVYAGSAFAPPPSLPAMRLVTLSHVLEHVPDVHAVLAAIAGMMDDDGLLFVEVPDATGYAEHVAARYEYFSTEHINHFSPALLERVVRCHGFEPVRLERKLTRCAPTDPYPAVFGLFRKHRGTARSSCEGPRDVQLTLALHRYAACFGERMHELGTQLSAALVAAERVRIWGAGELLLKLLGNSVLGQCQIQAIVDASPSKQGMHIAGVRVSDPSTLAASDAPIVVTSLVHRDSIVAAIRERLGDAQPVLTLH